MADPSQQYGQQNHPNPGYSPPSDYPQRSYPPPSGAYPPPEREYSNSGYPPTAYSKSGHQPGFIPPQPGATYDPETGMDDEIKEFAFTDETIKRAFIRKVYMILMLQLSIICGFIAIIIFHKPTKLWVFRHSELIWIAIAVLIVTVISMFCWESTRRKSPINFIFLILFTIEESFLLAVASALFESEKVLIAAGITAAVCFGLTMFAFQTKWDFTALGGCLLVCMIVFLLFGILAIFIKGKIMVLLYSSIGAFLFSMYLIYDTQLMLGGKHKYSINPEEYIFAALNVYLDIIQIFLDIVVGACEKLVKEMPCYLLICCCCCSHEEE